MTDWKLTTPVVFMVFRRPDTTARVFEVIRQVKPPKLLVVADGPHPDRAGEAEKCSAVRAIIEQVDWDCEVLKNYADTNLGCKQRVSSGLDWAFDIVEEAIILEDDTLPDITFFRFSQEMLERYRYHSQVMQVSGFNLFFGRVPSKYSYFFSKFGTCWGWASWRRAWKLYDLEMNLWPVIKNEGLHKAYPFAPYRNKIFEMGYNSKVSTWDYQWNFAILVNSGMSIVPAKSLVQNIGFGEGATHTINASYERSHIEADKMFFPLKSPEYILPNHLYDQLFLKTNKPTLSAKIRYHLKRIFEAIKR